MKLHNILVISLFIVGGCITIPDDLEQVINDQINGTTTTTTIPVTTSTTIPNTTATTLPPTVHDDSKLPPSGTSKQIAMKGGFVNNPANSRGKLKIIWPNTYTGHINKVIASTESGYNDVLSRALPNEYNDRQRYYGLTPIGQVPANLKVLAELDNGSSVWVLIPNPQQRYD